MSTAARDTIVEAAFRLFLERGYDSTSLARILESVPYSKGAFYHHFTSKEALLDAVIERFFTDQLGASSSTRPVNAGPLAHRMVDDHVDAFDAVAPYATPLAYHAFLTSVAVEALTEALIAQREPHARARHTAGDIIALIEGTSVVAVLRGDHIDRRELHAAVDRMLALLSL
jgi:AcrR family transcriptional regulator